MEVKEELRRTHLVDIAPVSGAISVIISNPDSTSAFARASSVSFCGANSLQKTKQLVRTFDR